MFRSQARGCYPEKDQPDGCYPDNDIAPSRFKCWEDTPSPSDLLRIFGSRDRTPPAPGRAPRRGRAAPPAR